MKQVLCTGREPVVKLFGKYIWQYRKTVLLFLVFVGIFAGIFSLYDLELEAVLYASGICSVIAVIFVGIHFYFYYKRHQQLQRIAEEITLLLEELPEPENLLEADYQEMLRSLADIWTTDKTNWGTERKESLDFYTAWVHQIKAPIAAMRLILQGEDTKEHQELLAELFRVEQYTDMVLSYFRLDGTTSDFVFQRYSLDAIIRQVVRKFASQFVRKRLRLEYEGTDAIVLTDEKWLTFILEQIISNAIKYTNSGCITITVDEKLVLSVSDTGMGIAEEDLPRIFEKGFTGYNGRADKKATGLGLYLCKRAADKLSHDISVTSTVGSGSCFRLNLATDDLEMGD